MTSTRSLPLLAMLLLALSIISSKGEYLTATPATVYESETMSAQNMDFMNNMFTAHSGWYNDKLVHYYKFRMYTPSTYPGVIIPGEQNTIHLQNIHFVTTTGDFDGVVGNPIIEYHNGVDGTNYSDFMHVNFISAPEGYVADTYMSVDDVVSSGVNVTASGIVLNIPVVPTNATLQHPVLMGDETAPIAPTPVWYNGVEVWTYVFEVTDQTAADFFDATRTDGDADYAITVLPYLISNDAVSYIPLWHMNQYTRGVTEGVNGGGPDPAGHKNIINMDRPDAGYSPLWEIYWVTDLPVDYMADQVSNVADMTPENGFEYTVTPMYVNCPDIGPVGDMINMDIAETYKTAVNHGDTSNWVSGSDLGLIMTEGVSILFVGDNETIGSTVTNMMGGFEYELYSSDLAMTILSIDIVMESDMSVLKTLEVVHSHPTDMDPSDEGDMDHDHMDHDEGDMDHDNSGDSSDGVAYRTFAIASLGGLMVAVMLL